MLVAILLIIINIYIFINTKEPHNFTVVKERYRILREHIEKNGPEEFKVLENEIPLVAHDKIFNKTLGYNTNKGYEIGLCIDGEPNEIMHVLIHELAHSTVDEYSHSSNFWEQTKKLKNICNELGIYQPINSKTRFCSSYIQDGE
jgi:predicted metal-dependent hydrolase